MTIDHTKCGSANSSAFPVLVSLSDTTLKTVGNSGHVQNSNGYDIWFFSDSGLTSRLPVERETYDGSAGTYVGWVQVPTVSYTVDTVIYIAYGDSGISADPNADTTYGKTHVWGTEYKGVWHLQDVTGGSGSVLDSTNANNGTPNGSPVNGAAKIAGGGAFNTTTKFVDLGTPASLEIYNTLTASAWVYCVSITGNPQFFISKDYSTGARGWGVGADGSNGYLYLEINGASAPFYMGQVPIVSAWFHVAIVLAANGTDWYAYRNGTLVGSGAATAMTANSSAKTYISGRQYSGYFQGFNGGVDEVHIANAARSASWILTEYNNQNSPGNIGAASFYTVGSEVVLINYSKIFGLDFGF
jgi:hypothetical protein